jgi:hypothetical protein
MVATLAGAEPDAQTNGFADTDCGTDAIAKTDCQNVAQTAQGGHAESEPHRRSNACSNIVAHGSAIVVSDTIAKPGRDSRNALVSDVAAHVSDDVRDHGSLPGCIPDRIADDLGDAHPICLATADRIEFIAIAKCDSDFARFADGVANRCAERHDEPVCSIIGPAKQFADCARTSAPNRDGIAAIGNPDTRTHRNTDIPSAGIECDGCGITSMIALF